MCASYGIHVNVAVRSLGYLFNRLSELRTTCNPTPTTLDRHSQRTNLVLCLILLVEECLQIDMASSDSMEDSDPAQRKVTKKSVDWTAEKVCRSS